METLYIRYVFRKKELDKTDKEIGITERKLERLKESREDDVTRLDFAKKKLKDELKEIMSDEK